MLLFCDGFDHYTTPSQKWAAADRQGIAAGAGRYRDAGYTESNGVAGTGGTLTKVIASPVATLIAAGAIKFDTRSHFRWEFQEGGTTHIEIKFDGSGHLTVARGINGTVLATGTAVLAVSTYYWLEVKVTVDDTNGYVEVRVNEAVDSTFTGDTRNGGATGLLDRFQQFTPYLGASGNGRSYLDDFVLLDTTGGVNNDFLGDTRVEVKLANGNGNSSDLVGSDGNSIDNYLLINEIPPDGDTTYVESSTTGDEDTYEYADIGSVSGQVFAVQVCPYARKTDGATRTIASRTRSAGIEEAGADKTLTSTFAYYPQVFEADPSGNPWTIASVNAAEFGVEVTA